MKLLKQKYIHIANYNYNDLGHSKVLILEIKVYVDVVEGELDLSTEKPSMLFKPQLVSITLSSMQSTKFHVNPISCVSLIYTDRLTLHYILYLYHVFYQNSMIIFKVIYCPMFLY